MGSTMTSPLNRTTAPQILRFFDVCFKQGVLDAYDLGDELESTDFLNTRKEDWRFGVLGQPDDFDWRSFRFTLYWWARRAQMTGLAENYIFKIKVKNFLWCFLAYCMRFYLMGIEEWLAYPNPVNIEVFKTQRRVHWDNNSVVKNFTKGDYISYMHEMEHAFLRLPEDSMQVTPAAMGSFISAIYDLTQKYVR